MLLPPTPLSLLCAILLCLPLTILFTFTTPPSTTASHGGATTSPLPIVINSTQPIPKQSSSTPSTLTTQLNSQSNNKTTRKITYQPPEIQENDERDDSRLFKRASKVDPNPKPVKKLALMFLTTSQLPLAPLWEMFFSRAASNLYNVYVHASPNNTINYSKSFRGVFANRVIPSKRTRRHSPTLVSAARRLLAHALLHDKSNAMFALLSPSCIPIHSFNYTYRSLMRYSRKSFVEILDNEPGAYERWAARGEDVMEPEVEYDDFRIGSQFWVMKRRHARVVVKDTRLWSKFKLPCLSNDTCYPDEHYFPTLLNMVDPHGCVPCTLTHVDWRNSSDGHPRAYNASEVTPGLIRAIRKERPRYGDEDINGTDWSVRRRRRHPFLFARKFSAGSLDQLIRMAKHVIFRD